MLVVVLAMVGVVLTVIRSPRLGDRVLRGISRLHPRLGDRCKRWLASFAGVTGNPARAGQLASVGLGVALPVATVVVVTHRVIVRWRRRWPACPACCDPVRARRLSRRHPDGRGETQAAVSLRRDG